MRHGLQDHDRDCGTPSRLGNSAQLIELTEKPTILEMRDSTSKMLWPASLIQERNVKSQIWIIKRNSTRIRG